MLAQQRLLEKPVETQITALLIPPDKVSVPEQVWRVFRFVEEEFKEEDHVPYISFITGCYSVHRPLPGSTIPYHQIGARGRIGFDAEGMKIASITPHEKPETKKALVRIRLRFNTGHLKNSKEPPWRLCFDQGNGYQEVLIESFVLHGFCYTTKDLVREKGVFIDKWHISCLGRFVLQGKHAELISYE